MIHDEAITTFFHDKRNLCYVELVFSNVSRQCNTIENNIFF